jgi:predicted flap endonuclease-1-like 5' DNA nuclease
MRIRYVGQATMRRALGYEWNRHNGYAVEVADADDAVELLTHPPGDFTVDGDEPLANLPEVGPQHVAELALAGVTRLADLAALDDEGIKGLAGAIWAGEKQVKKWVERALRQGSGQARESLVLP